MSNKTTRQIQIRDDLWRRVEALAARRSITTDAVVQAALVQLFSKKKQKAAPSPAPAPAPAPEPAPEPVHREPTPPPMPQAASPRRPPPPRPSPGLPKPTGARRPAGGPPPPSSRAASSRPARPLYLNYDGQWYVVDQDEFVIGRGSKYSDLAIKDANISRRHCAVVRRGGEYFMMDLGSTNGVEFQGRRVDNHRIEEGASYRMCDHEVRFSYIPPA